MHKQIIVNTTPNEVRVGLLEDNEPVEFSMERADNRRVVGNVYKGVVTAVRPGLQAAFVEIGMEKAGFLHVSDLIHDSPDDEDDRGGRGGRRRRRGREGMRPIETMLKEGDEILVQVTKEIIGTKGPRLTADVSLPGRFMVLMPKGDHVGVSRKIEDRRERHRLRDLLSALKPEDEGGAFIIRTAAIGIESKMLERDMDYLRRMYKEIQEKAHSMPAPALVHQDVGLLVGMIRDIFKDDIDRVEVDSRDDYQELMQYVKNFSPELRERIHLYEGDVPIFDKYGVEQELKKSLERKVWMKRGGFLVIDETEALVAIDVNTGRYTGKKNQAETIFKTNMLAAKEISRQLRLRDVGGIIVLDFIDMESEEDKRRVLAELRTHLKRDRARTKTFPITDLGLVEMSRQRVQQSLKDRLSDDCPYCRGAGQVLSTETLANKVENLILKLAATRNEKAVQIRANPTLALMLMSDRANSIQNVARATGIRIDVVDDPRLHREEFQIISTQRRKDLVAETERALTESAGGRPTRTEQPERRPARSESERPRRGRSQSEERDSERPAQAQRGARNRDEDAGEGRGRSRRRGRRGSEDRPRTESEAAPEKSSRAADSDRAPQRDGESAPRTRTRRRRGGTPRDGERAAPDSVTETSPEASATTGNENTSPVSDHPAMDDEDSPRRRRRRGRRGGRGRRRSREDGEGAENGANATADSQQAEEPVVQPAPSEDRPARSQPRRERPRAEEAANPSPAPVSENNGDEAAARPKTRRIRRQRSDRPNEAEAPTSAPTGTPQPESTESRPRRRSESSRSEGEPSTRRGSSRRRQESQPEATTSPVAARDEFVKAIPEENYLRKQAEENQSAEASKPAPPIESPAPPKPQPAPAADSAQQSSEAESRQPRRRRRTRRVGTPTHLIGTGKTESDD